MSSAPAALRVFIYGSCVSRDTFELLDSGAYTLVAYVARQSLISSFGPTEHATGAPPGLSPFQRRMVEGDLRGDLLAKLASAAPTIDLLLWDLTDERLGVYRSEGGGYVTRTVDIIGTELDRDLATHGALIPFGSTAHLELWKEAASRWKEVLVTAGLMERTLVLAPDWAEHSSDGSAPPASFGLAPAVANDLYQPYYAHLSGLGFPVERVGSESATAAHDHRWGRAPFHYDETTYRLLIAAIERHSGRRRPSSRGTS